MAKKVKTDSENILEIKEITLSIQSVLNREYDGVQKKKNKIVLIGTGLGIGLIFSKIITLHKVFFSLWI